MNLTRWLECAGADTYPTMCLTAGELAEAQWLGTDRYSGIARLSYLGFWVQKARTLLAATLSLAWARLK